MSDLRMTPFSFRLFGFFSEAEDRLNQEFNPGRFFHFSNFGSEFSVPITDPEVWKNPPQQFAGVWITGWTRTNRYGNVELAVTDFFEPDDRNPAPSQEWLEAGGEFSGLGSCEKSVYTTKTGEQGFKFLIRALGLLYSQKVERELYDRMPNREIVVLRGRSGVRQEFNQSTNGRRTIYTLHPNDFTTLEQIKARRQAERERGERPEPPISDSSATSGGRQAINPKNTGKS